MQPRSRYGGNNRSRSFAPHKRRNNMPRPSGVHYSRYINKAIEPEQETPYVPTHAFNEFGLSARTTATLQHLGFTTPSPIQDQCIPPALEGKDIIGLANTGTGKTAAFLLPIIEKLSTSGNLVSVLVLAPTRELAQQIDEEFRRFSSGQRLYSTLVVGGMNINRQIQQVKRGPHVIIGTPGRVKDLIDRRVLRLQNVDTFVLDEADRMCDMGFVKDIRTIESELPKDRQTFCYSATMTDDVRMIVHEFMRDPVSVSVVRSQTNDHIDQDVIHARDKQHKLDLLTELLKQPEFEKVMIFGETKYGVQRLADKLTKDQLPAVAIHGNKSQAQRERALKSFKNDQVKVLVATDVAARGIDIQDVSHVINFDPPKVYEDYVHRIGRTGRAGKTGKALTFVIK
jgi:ATP-dependent RNA helicase RhlE